MKTPQVVVEAASAGTEETGNSTVRQNAAERRRDRKRFFSEVVRVVLLVLLKITLLYFGIRCLRSWFPDQRIRLFPVRNSGKDPLGISGPSGLRSVRYSVLWYWKHIVTSFLFFV